MGAYMTVRQATLADLECVLRIYSQARAFMREQGNASQWAGGYPDESLLREDIRQHRLYLCVDDREILGVFCYFYGDDPTYAYIENGAWLNDRPYGVIHRIAVAVHGKGVAKFCFDYAFSRCRNLKIDTHADNFPMQKLLVKNGFAKCGTIYLENGDPRIAYQKI